MSQEQGNFARDLDYSCAVANSTREYRNCIQFVCSGDVLVAMTVAAAVVGFWQGD